jgi:hypothetical protein
MAHPVLRRHEISPKGKGDGANGCASPFPSRRNHGARRTDTSRDTAASGVAIRLFLGVVYSAMAKNAHDTTEPADKPKVEPHTELIVRNNKGQFLAGHIGIGGRKPGSRNALSTQLINDVFTVWSEKGIECLRRLADEDPGKFATLAVALVPREAKVETDITVRRGLDALEAFRLLQSLPRQQLKQLQDGAINADD